MVKPTDKVKKPKKPKKDKDALTRVEKRRLLERSTKKHICAKG
jgi:hypothetical protein